MKSRARGGLSGSPCPEVRFPLRRQYPAGTAEIEPWAGRYFAAITADGVELAAAPQATVPAVGVDVGLRSLAVVHDGEEARSVPAPKALAGKLVRLRREPAPRTAQALSLQGPRHAKHR